MNTDKNTEEKILDAAKTVFVQYSYDGASMQKIATEAGINKALLHYYFRNKEKLFQAAFVDIFKRFMPALQQIFQSESDFFDKLRKFIATYIDLLLTQPMVPIFILQEINRNPDILFTLITQTGINPEFFAGQALKEMEKGTIIRINPRHLFINILALCIFPIAARPLLQRVFFENDQKNYEDFLQERKKEVSEFIINAISKK